MGGLSLAPDFDEHDTKNNQDNCWCFPVPSSSDDHLTPPSEAIPPSDNRTWTTNATLKDQKSPNLISPSLTPTLNDQKFDDLSFRDVSPIRLEPVAGSHSSAFYQSLSQSTNLSSTTMPPKRTAGAAKLDDKAQPLRKSTRTSKPTPKKAAATDSPTANKKEESASHSTKTVVAADDGNDSESDESPVTPLPKRRARSTAATSAVATNEHTPSKKVAVDTKTDSCGESLSLLSAH